MTEKGRHTDGASTGFYRDLAMMVLGILALGAAIFLLLFWLAEGPEQGPPTTPLAAAATTVTTAPETTMSTAATTEVTTTTTVPTSTTVPVRPPEEVRVVVLNSMGLAGAAGRLTEELEEAGYQPLQADDYEPELDPSRIWYREGFSAEANVLLEYLPDAVVQPLEDEDLQEGADVIMILGSGYEE
ncbi:MAG: LytR C-terminal domain-containing protein [Actinobacteria bacterium]|nr:LytR C-terminal domain-containing protein [Actinomycetota bacterium]